MTGNISHHTRPSINFKDVAYHLHRSLHEAMKEFPGLAAGTMDVECWHAFCDMSAEQAGNIFDVLCWHAYEKDRGEFILAVVWQAANQPSIGASASPSGQIESPLAPPPGLSSPAGPAQPAHTAAKTLPGQHGRLAQTLSGQEEVYKYCIYKI